MTAETLSVDVAMGAAVFQDQEVQVAVPVIVHTETLAIVWQSPVVVPLIMEDWRQRCVNQHSTLRESMRAYWPEVEVYVNWWLIEPGQDEAYPYGLSA